MKRIHEEVDVHPWKRDVVGARDQILRDGYFSVVFSFGGDLSHRVQVLFDGGFRNYGGCSLLV